MNKHLPFIRFRRKGFLRLFVLATMVSTLFGARALILGPYDTNRDGNAELLLVLNKTGGPALELVEDDPENGSRSVWAYSLPENIPGSVTGAEIFDLNNDGYPECVITVLTLGLESVRDIPTMYVFRGTETGFLMDPIPVFLENEMGVKVRPSGLSIITRNGVHYTVISQGTPARDLLLFSLELNESSIEKGDLSTLGSILTGTGYSPVYTGNIGKVELPDPVAITLEDNVLKIALFNVDEMGQAGLSLEKEIILEDNHNDRVFGMGVTSFDWDSNGFVELLIPFISGKILALDLSSGELELIKPGLDRKLLFLGGTEDLEKELETIFAREMNRQKKASETLDFNKMFMNAENRDTVVLGEEFFFDILPDSTADFYSFVWESTPPAGCTFEPESGEISWFPARDQIGAHLLIFRYEKRQGIEHKISEDERGDTHEMVPVLSERTSSFAVLVVDSIKPEEPKTLILDDLVSEEPVAADMFTMTLTKPSKDPAGKYTFSSEPPFGVKARELPIINEPGAVLSYIVSGNLASIKPGNEAIFSYMPTSDTAEFSSSLTLVQDYENNLVLISLDPKVDTIPQWVDPENYSADLHMFPHFYFEGFGTDLKAASEDGGLAFRFHEEGIPERIQASIRIQLPTANPEELVLFIEEGAIGEMTGSVKVKENGSKKIELKFKTAGQILPSSLIVRKAQLSEELKNIKNQTEEEPVIMEQEAPITNGGVDPERTNVEDIAPIEQDSASTDFSPVTADIDSTTFSLPDTTLEPEKNRPIEASLDSLNNE